MLAPPSIFRIIPRLRVSSIDIFLSISFNEHGYPFNTEKLDRTGCVRTNLVCHFDVYLDLHILFYSVTGES